MLVSSDKTSYRKLSVSLLTIEPGMETESVRPGEESIYFVIDGRGTAVVNWLKGLWRYPVKPYSTLWIPGLQHRIRNCGDASLRCLLAAFGPLDELDDRYIFVEVSDANKQPSRLYLGGNEVFIFTPGTLGPKSRLNYCGYATLYPGGSMHPHVPTDDCEETMYVTRGQGNMTVGDEKRDVEPGSVTYVPRGTLHCEQSTGQEQFEYVVVENHE